MSLTNFQGGGPSSTGVPITKVTMPALAEMKRQGKPISALTAYDYATSRLVDEALTIPLFGGRRAIRVRAGSRSFASGIDALAETPLRDCRIVIEAGELRAESPLRKACERAKTAVAIACYPDTERDLARLIDDELKLSNLRVASDARAVLITLLGGDRQASRNELRKLTLYAHGKGEVTLDDVMAVVADASELKIDPIVDAAFAGNPHLVETEFAKAMVAGLYPGVIISAAQRVEHYEMAAYGSARTFAELLGEREAVRLLEQTLEEEKAADAKLTQVARKVNVEAKAA